MTPERETEFRELAAQGENADPTDTLKMCDATAALRRERDEDLAAVGRELIRRAENTTVDSNVAMDRLLSLETPDVAAEIRANLEDGWEKDWNGAFGRAVRKLYGEQNSQQGG